MVQINDEHNIYCVKWAATWQNQQCGYAPSEDSDQPGHPPCLIRVFAVRMKKAWVLSYPLSAQRRLWSDWADAQADLSLRWAHSHFVGFVMKRLKWLCEVRLVCLVFVSIFLCVEEKDIFILGIEFTYTWTYQTTSEFCETLQCHCFPFAFEIFLCILNSISYLSFFVEINIIWKSDRMSIPIQPDHTRTVRPYDYTPYGPDRTRTVWILSMVRNIYLYTVWRRKRFRKQLPGRRSSYFY